MGQSGEKARLGRFDSLRNRDYRVLFLSGVFIFLATHAQQIARGWLANELTNSNAGIGGVFMGFGAAMLVASFTSGVIADRYPKRTVLMIAQGAILAGALFIAVALAFDALQYWMLVVASVLHGGGMANMGPVRVSYTTDLVDRSRLPNALVLTQMSLNATRIIGPSLAGTLIGIKWIGAGGVYIVTSTLIVIAIIWTSMLPLTPAAARASHLSPARAFVEGVGYVRRFPQIAGLVVVANLIAIIGLPYMAFLPKMVDSIFHRDASAYGTMSTVSAIGALSASVWIAGRVAHAEIARIQTVAGFAFALALIGFAAVPNFVSSLAVIAVLGAASSIYQVSNNALVATVVDGEYQGRVQALLMMGFSVSSMMTLPFGFVADRFGIRQTTLCMGIACLMVMLVSITVVRRRSIEPTNESADDETNASFITTRLKNSRHREIFRFRNQ